MSLIEVMLAVAILAGIFLSTISVLPTAFQAQRKAEEKALAASVGTRLLERARAKGFQEIEPESGTSTVTLISNGRTRTEDFLYNLSVSSVDDDLKNLTLTIRKKDSGTSDSMVIETRVFGDAGLGGQR
jgi:type II secretory pathway pseudopilin PulG